MKIQISFRKSLIILPVFMLLVLGLQAQHELGVLPLKTYSSKEYGALPQNWGITQDHRGFIYVANEEGVLEFDGEHWRKIMISDQANRGRSISFGFNKRVYVGARDEFGYLHPDKNGVLHFVSLVPLLDSTLREAVGDIWNIVATNKGVYFRSRTNVFFYDGKQIKPIKSPYPIHRIYPMDNGIIASVRVRGLCIPKGDSLVPLVNGSYFLKDTVIPDVYGIVPWGKKMLAVCRIKGLIVFTIDNHGVINHQPLLPILPGNLKANFSNVFDLKVLDNNIFTIATEGDGVCFFTKDGKLIRKITTAVGLSDDVITNQFCDRSGYLWLSHSNGITAVMTQSPYEKFTKETSGLDGAVESVIRFNKRIYAATQSGLYMSELPVAEGSFLDFISTKFVRIAAEGLNTQCFHLSVFKTKEDSLLLICANDGVYQLNTANAVSRISKCLPWATLQPQGQGNTMLIAHESGIMALSFDKGKWNDLGNFPSIQAECKNFSQDTDSNIWVGTIRDGVFMIQRPELWEEGLQNIKVIHLDTTSNLSYGKPNFIMAAGNKIFAGTSNGVFSYMPDTKRFDYDSAINKKCTSYEMFIHRLSFEAGGNLWSVVMHDEGKWSEVRFVNLTTGRECSPWADDQREIINALHHEEDGVSWLGGTIGLLRYREKAAVQTSVFNTYIRWVQSAQDTLFGGTWLNNDIVVPNQPESLIPVLKYRQNSLLFRFAAISPNSELGLKYSYWLEGSDEKSWSDWSATSEKEYTFLHEGTYRLHVRAKDVFGNISTEDVYEFVILPPWYRTIWAYLLYLLLFALFVWMAIHVSTRSLQKIIKERTAEIVKQKDVIEQKNKDIMDSISYARRIQETILPSRSLVNRYLPNAFILYKPRDIVSGDFYWLQHRAGKTLLAAADCTGHGVPGAFMSILGVTFLNEITSRREVQHANQVLEILRENVIQSLSSDGGEGGTKDGMDIAFLVLDDRDKTCEFAGAYNSLLIIRNGEVIEYKADRMPIGAHTRQDEPFTNHNVEVQKGDHLYIFSDGFIDQFGGEEGKKFMSKRFKDLLISISHLPLEVQKERLNAANEEWRGHHEQVDDVLVIGVKIDW